MIKLISFISMVLAASSYQEARYLDREQMMCLATAVYHEARGEDAQGMVAVAHNVLNRRRSAKFPDSTCGVVHQPHQYTGIRHARPDYNSDAWENAVQAAVFAELGVVQDPTNGSLWYYNPDKVRTPEWARGLQGTKIGNHIFLR